MSRVADFAYQVRRFLERRPVDHQAVYAAAVALTEAELLTLSPGYRKLARACRVFVAGHTVLEDRAA